MKEVVLKQQEVESREILRITEKKKWRYFTVFKERKNKCEADGKAKQEGKESVMLLRRWREVGQNVRSSTDFLLSQSPVLSDRSLRHTLIQKLHAACHSSLLHPKGSQKRCSHGTKTQLVVNRRAWVQIPAVGFCTIVKLHLQTSQHPHIDALGTFELSALVKAVWGCEHSGSLGSNS